MLVTVPAATLTGIEGHPAVVEVHVSAGLPGFSLVDMPDATCRATRDRIGAALLCSGFRWPPSRITVNLAPPGRGRLSAGLDLAVAIGILAADGQLDPAHLAQRGFVGELGLDGSLRPVPGVLPLVEAVTAPEVVVPAASAAEASAGGHRVLPAGNLSEVVAALSGRIRWPGPEALPLRVVGQADAEPGRGPRGVGRLPTVRWAAMVAAAGGHHLVLVGRGAPTAAALARWSVDLLPDLDDDHALEVARVHSVAGPQLPAGVLVRRPPLRCPHWSTSAVSLVGGGTSQLRPGEVSLAHRGVLALDDLPEFSPAVLDNLRRPMEAGTITVVRAATKVALPARFQLVASMHRCPCEAETPAGCRCSDGARIRYARRAPRLDRFDIVVDPSCPVPVNQGFSVPGTAAAVAQRVLAVRRRAFARGVAANGELDAVQLRDLAPLSADADSLLEEAVRRGQLSGRGHWMVQRLALTIADLAGAEPPLSRDHAALALALRAARPAGGST